MRRAPRSSTLGGSQERYREWYQSQITKHSKYNDVYNHIQIIRVFESHWCRTVLTRRSYLRYSRVLRKGTASQNNTQWKIPYQQLIGLTEQRAVWQPKKCSPLRLTSPLCSTKLRATHSNGGHVDAKTSHTLTTCHGGGRNSPHIPTTIPLHNYPATNSQLHPCARSRLFTRHSQSYALLLVAYWNCSFALVWWEPPANDEAAETLLEIWLVESSRTRLAVPMEAAKPTGQFRSRATRTPFGTAHAPSLRGRLRMDGSPLLAVPINALGRRSFLPNLEHGPVGGAS